MIGILVQLTLDTKLFKILTHWLEYNMFENLEEPTEFDYELVKILYRLMTVEERTEFSIKIKETFSQNDLIATKELAKTIIATRI